MGRLCDPATVIAAVMIAFLSGSGGAVAYDKQSGLAHLFNHTTCTQYAEDRRLPEGVGANSSDKLYIAGFLTWISQTIEAHRGADSEKIVVAQQFCSDPRRCPDADRV